jgi:RNA polymerase sigma factor (sigma-70 family)
LFQPQLIADCINGNQKAQRELYLACYQILIKVAKRYVKNEDNVMEIVTNSYLKILKNLSKINNEQSTEAWVKRIGINTAIDFYRSQKTYNAHIKLNAEYSYNAIENLHVDFNTIDKNLEANYIYDIINNLPDNTREVINLYAIDGYNHKDIAQMLQISEETSRWHVFRARKLITEKLKEIELNNTYLNKG